MAPCVVIPFKFISLISSGNEAIFANISKENLTSSVTLILERINEQAEATKPAAIILQEFSRNKEILPIALIKNNNRKY